MTLLDDVRAYMDRHRLSVPRMADRVGISPKTLKSILSRNSERSRHAERLAEAIKSAPEPREPVHADLVREHWGKTSSEAIGKLARPAISGARVRAIAKEIGLPALR